MNFGPKIFPEVQNVPPPVAAVAAAFRDSGLSSSLGPSSASGLAWFGGSTLLGQGCGWAFGIGNEMLLFQNILNFSKCVRKINYLYCSTPGAGASSSSLANQKMLHMKLLPVDLSLILKSFLGKDQKLNNALQCLCFYIKGITSSHVSLISL